MDEIYLSKGYRAATVGKYIHWIVQKFHLCFPLGQASTLRLIEFLSLGFQDFLLSAKAIGFAFLSIHRQQRYTQDTCT